MGQKTWPRPAALDGQRRHRMLRDRLAVPAAHLRAGMDNNLEVRGHVFQNLALVRTDLRQIPAAAVRADAGRVMLNRLARQMLRQWLTAWRGAFAPHGWRGGGFAAFNAFRLRFLKLVDVKFHLLDLLVELLGGTPEPRAPQKRQLGLEFFDVKGLGVNFVLQDAIFSLKRRREGAEFNGI